MHTARQATRRAILAALIGLCAAADAAAAAQRSLAQIISDSFENSTAQAADATAVVQQPVAVPMKTSDPVAMQVVPSQAEPAASAPAGTRLQAELGAPMKSLDEPLERSIHRFHEVVIAPERLQPIPPADPAMGCNDLYAETTRLVALGERYRPAYSEDPRNIAIGAAGFVFAPAFYLYGVTAYAAWYENGHRKTAKRRLTELRRLMAERRCFARD